MSNIIAVIWDCDRTLIDGYMQDPMFEEYGIDAAQFWKDETRCIEEYEAQGIKVNHDTFYLNYFIRAAQGRIPKYSMPGLNNAKLREFGKKQKFYKGVLDLMKSSMEMLDKNCAEFGIQVEHYIVSTGFSEVIKGSPLMDYVKDVWGCELIEEGEGADAVISEVAYTIDNTTKTRALFEINKGTNVLKDVDVNANVPMESRRVKFENMIYIADGPSDIPAFSLIRKNGGATFAIYPKGDAQALNQVDTMRADGRVDMYAEADYSEGTTAYMWITRQIRARAEAIMQEERNHILNSVSGVPKHLI